jgi:ribosomal protein S18 acetylase RimI-like enzyme
MIVERAKPTDENPIVQLLTEQARGFHALDARFADRETEGWFLERVRSWLAMQDLVNLVARDGQGGVVGYGGARVQTLPEGHEWREWAPRTAGVWEGLAVRPPRFSERAEILAALVQSSRREWRSEALTGEYALWPSSDSPLGDALVELGLVRSAHLAYTPVTSSWSRGSGRAMCREARETDFPALWRLRSEQSDYHLQHCRFQRRIAGAEEIFRQQFDAAVHPLGDPADRPLISVVESDGAVVGFVATEIQTMGPGNTRYLPAGRYGYIHNAAVDGSFRGRGMGRDLLEYARLRLQDQHLKGLVLWYVEDNPLSRVFWPRLGFRNLWTRYEMRHESTAPSTELTPP